MSLAIKIFNFSQVIKKKDDIIPVWGNQTKENFALKKEKEQVRKSTKGKMTFHSIFKF